MMKRVHLARACALAVVLSVCGLLGAAPAHADGPRLLLSWHQPWGTPGASDRLVSACDDTTEIDTLYLSFQSDRTFFNILGMEAVLYFHPVSGDTLQDFWFFRTGWPNQGNMLIDFDYRSRFPCETPWTRMGKGRVAYDHRSGRGRLDLSFTVPVEPGRGISPAMNYCVARVAIRQRRNDLPGCRQPVCIEWASLRLRPRAGDEVEITQGERFVTWGPESEQSCRHQGLGEPEPWRPPVPVGNTPATR